MTKLTTTIALLACALLAACGGGDDEPLPATADVQACSLPADQSVILARCGVLVDPAGIAFATVEYAGTVQFNNPTGADVVASRSFTVGVNGPAPSAQTVSATVPAGGSVTMPFSVKVTITAAALGGAQIAEVTLGSRNTGAGESRMLTLTRTLVRQAASS